MAVLIRCENIVTLIVELVNLVLWIGYYQLGGRQWRLPYGSRGSHFKTNWPIDDHLDKVIAEFPPFNFIELTQY